MMAEILIFVPSVARFREDYLMLRLERAQIASLAVLAADSLDPALEQELLDNAGVFNVVLRRDEVSQLALSSPVPAPLSKTVDLRSATGPALIAGALDTLFTPQNQVIRVIGDPVQEGGLQIEVTMETGPLRDEMLDYGLRILLLSAVISIVTAALLFFAVRSLLVKPIKGLVGHMADYAAQPEDSSRIIEPKANLVELREAETALQSMETQLTQALRQKERLAQLGGAVAKVSHDLRNILTSAQLFVDRIGGSEDPLVRRMAPKLVGSITRAVNLTEATLAFGRAEEPPPQLGRVRLAQVVGDVIESERLAAGDSDVSFSVDVPAGMVVRADGEQLFRILLNLVRNARAAIVATGEPGEICVRGTETETAWEIAVADTGPGLPPKAREHLFQPFQGRVAKGGSGLGLTIAAELARGHGGEIALVRTGPEGTEFRLTLPQSRISAAAR
ncbi:sensor histidine kinase [Wenxinia saemankumensis]|nr:HAMP domain-containing sensor histidine kinase [Wenxinia saemankumensis]